MLKDPGENVTTREQEIEAKMYQHQLMAAHSAYLYQTQQPQLALKSFQFQYFTRPTAPPQHT